MSERRRRTRWNWNRNRIGERRAQADADGLHPLVVAACEIAAVTESSQVLEAGLRC